MSRSPVDGGSADPSQSYLDSWGELAGLIRKGRSFSGKERNCCFLNTRKGRFADVSSVTGLDHIDDGRTVALSDWDRDGDLDLLAGGKGADDHNLRPQPSALEAVDFQRAAMDKRGAIRG